MLPCLWLCRATGLGSTARWKANLLQHAAAVLTNEFPHISSRGTPRISTCHATGLGGASRWKANLLQHAAAVFAGRAADLAAYVYSQPAVVAPRATQQDGRQVSDAIIL